MPELVRTGVHNFFGNFRDGWSAVNQLLQAKLGGADDALRLATNTFGLAGILDVASEVGSSASPRISARRWAAGACPRARTSCGRCSARRRCATCRPVVDLAGRPGFHRQTVAATSA